MTWLTWRQHRAEVYAVSAIFALVGVWFFAVWVLLLLSLRP